MLWPSSCAVHQKHVRSFGNRIWCTDIRIHGIVVPENESNDNVMAIVKSCPEKINVPFDKDIIDHVHRVGI